METSSPPSPPLPQSPSYTVSSPRRTLSLLKKRREDKKAAVPIWDGEKQMGAPFRDSGSGVVSGPKPAEVYGFVGAITTVIATVMFLVWAYTPEPWLHWLGITYYPSKYWALAIPAYAMVIVVLAILFYVALNFIDCPSPTSFNTIFDEYSREPLQYEALDKEADRPIDPISDIGIDHINNLMFGTATDVMCKG